MDRISFTNIEQILAADKVNNPERYEHKPGNYLIFQRENATWYYRENRDVEISINGKLWSFYCVVYF
jgi:hypothetical protein